MFFQFRVGRTKSGNYKKSLSKYGIFSGPYFLVFGMNAGKYGQKKLRIWTIFHAVKVARNN